MSAIRTKTLTVAGALAQKPHAGGHTWALLQYVLGFRQLGWNVLFLDQIDARMCTDAAGQPCPPEDSIQARYFHDVMTRFDLQDACALVVDGGQFLGLSRPRVLERLSASPFLLNIMGYLQIDDLLAAVPARVFLDIDPGFGQMWKALGLHDPFRGHDAHVTIGLRIGEPDCPIPTGGISWITTPQPIALDYWPVTPRVTDGPFTSVASWRGANGPVTFEGRTYGLRVHEFRKFAALPALTGRPFAVALDIHADDARDRDLLIANGWRLDDPRQVAGDPDAYQAYIQGSAAEFLTAKNMYVQTNSGWISDRSLCYLASGRPVLAQDTGFGAIYPTDAGLLRYRTLDDACAGVEAICAGYDRQARAARMVATEIFDATRVLGRLLAALGVS